MDPQQLATPQVHGWAGASSSSYRMIRVPRLIACAVKRPRPAIRDFPTHSSLFMDYQPVENMGCVLASNGEHEPLHAKNEVY
jgi:hypothetical protein